MFCPRCGMQNTETTKFCRQCGLPMTQITGFVTTGGTGALTAPAPMPQPAAPIQLPETSEMLALKQKKVMTMLAMIILPIVFTIIGEEMFNAGEVLAATFLLIPLGIVWASFRYKTDLRRLQEQQLQQYYAMQQQPIYQQPVRTPPPGFQSQAFSPTPPAQLPPPPTNPFNLANPAHGSVPHGSVIEDDTRKLPIGNRSGQ